MASCSSSANVQDVSVYGTTSGFRGRAYPGRSTTGDAAWEYGLTRKWVLALDLVAASTRSTPVTGANISDPVGTTHDRESGSSRMFGDAPAVEYNRSSTLGVRFGTRVITAGGGTNASITPAIGINVVLRSRDVELAPPCSIPDGGEGSSRRPCRERGQSWHNIELP